MRVRTYLFGTILAIFPVILMSGSVTAKTVKYNIKDDAIAKSLTGKPGDAIKGRNVAINRKLGNCLACHKMPAPEQQYHGNIGPDLAGIGSRYNAGELRLRVVDPKVVNADTSMPAYYRTEGLHRVLKQWQGKTLLSARQVEDVVAYLATLREDTSFKDAFAWARKANLKIFQWKGKVFSTGVKP